MEQFLVDKGVVQLCANPTLLNWWSSSKLASLAEHIKVVEHPIVLRSGQKSRYYIDFKGSFAANPYVFAVDLPLMVRDLLWNSSSPKVAFLAGKGVSGHILVTIMAARWPELCRPVYVRSLPREHGIIQAVIGEVEGDAPLYILDDVLSTGGTLREMLATLPRDRVKEVCVVVRRAPIEEVDGVPVKWIFDVQERI